MITALKSAGRTQRMGAVAACLGAALLAGACSPGDVELNGKLFDAVGASGVLGKQAGSAKMAERQGLVVPPSLDRLPPPSETVPTAQLAEVKDPDKMKRVSAADLKEQQAAYCKEHYEFAKQRGDAQADQAVGPAGPCRVSALDMLTKWNKGETDEAPVEETTASIPQNTNSKVTAVPSSSVQVGTVTAVPAKAR